MSLTVGQAAPAISLYDTEKNLVSLASFKGKNVVVLFFPLAFTGVCTAELCNVRDNIAAYNNTNAVVLGISVDSIFTLGKFKEEQNLNFPLLSDFNKEAAKAFGVLYETFPAFEMLGVSKRAAFVLDQNGVIQYAEVCPTPGDLPDFTAIQSTLAGLSA
jgi:peroxiredoxin